jgi:hypothetical protein
MDATAARTRITEIRSTGGQTTIDELDGLWAALPPARPGDILGSWKGSEFTSGHRFEGYLPKIRWHGKRFTSYADVAPLVCRDENGELFDDVERAKGGASLWTVEFRGEPTATMVYDGQPVLDHFKWIDDDTLLGVMNGKGVLDDGRHYYFVLERE